jgi:hyaluronan synthase
MSMGVLDSRTAPDVARPVPQASSSRREHQRVALDLRTTLHAPTGMGRRKALEVRVLDLSPGGARIEVAHALTPGECVTLDLPPDLPTPRRADGAGGAPGQQALAWPRGRLRAQVRADPDALPSDGVNTFGLVFARTALSRGRCWLMEQTSWLALAALVAAVVPLVRLKEANLSLFWLHPLANAYSLLVSAYIVSRLLLALAYRPRRDTGHRPSVSVIVACKNEEASIARTLRCIFRSRYPADRLEVIAVDDGSTDGTLAEMRRTALAHPSLQIVAFPRNRGKRHAMAEGARAARGEILVYVDSDSFLHPSALTLLASTFSDPSVAAVCGHADVQNARTNFLTKMQEVRYYVAFRIVKAAESVFSAVTCCSGCLAAYRRACVMEVLDHWLGQRFLGVPATFGDDRALTRLMLKRHRVVYHSEALCTTIVPDRWRIFFRQQLRWKKSWIRENVLLAGFMWKRNPVMAVSYYMSVLFPLVSPGIVLHALGLPLVGIGTFSFLYIYGAVLMASLYALVYLARHRTSLWLYGVWFSLFYMFTLVWQTYYALVTIRHNQWGTR